MSFADYMQRSVLTPLGMSNSSFDTGRSSSPLMAKGYRDHEIATEPTLRDIPAGGLNSNVIDMSRFMSMMFADGTSGNHQIIKPETINEMLRPQNTDVALDFNLRIGLGWLLDKQSIENAGTIAHHGGATLLFQSQMNIAPDHKLGVVVLANSSTAREVVDHIADETLTLALEAKTGIHQQKRDKVNTDTTTLSEVILRDYVGSYTTKLGFVRLYADGKGLRAEVAGRNFDLVRGVDGLFRLEYSILGIFHINLGGIGEIGLSRRNVSGRDLLVARIGSRETLVGQRVWPPSNSSTWQQYLGNYEIINLDGDLKRIERISLIEDHGLLLIELTLAEKPHEKARIPLMPVSETEAVMLGMLNDGGDTVRVVKVDGEERVLYSGYQLKKVLQ